MEIKREIQELFLYVKEHESVLCPVLAAQDGVLCSALIAYIADEKNGGILFYGISRMIILKEGEVTVKKASPPSRESIVFIAHPDTMEGQERQKKLEAYIYLMDTTRKQLETGQVKPEVQAELSKAFRQFIPPEIIPTLRQYIPEYLEIMKL